MVNGFHNSSRCSQLECSLDWILFSVHDAQLQTSMRTASDIHVHSSLIVAQAKQKGHTTTIKHAMQAIESRNFMLLAKLPLYLHVHVHVMLVYFTLKNHAFSMHCSISDLPCCPPK